MNPDYEKAIDVSVVIPAYNEEKAIATTLDAVLGAVSASPRRYEVIVVNDGSADGTAAVAASKDVHVVTHRRNRGYGASLKSGTLAAKGAVVLFYDADNQFDSPSANAFRMLAQQTNGAFFAYSGKEEFPASEP